MNILYIAYSCDPYEGSEDKIGWRVPYECAKTNRVFVITKEEHRKPVERYMQTHQVDNIEHFYVDIPPVFKRFFRGFLYSARLNIWHRHALAVARQICRDENIQLIHQITPVEFRAIGRYAQIPGVKFVCGPMGGGEQIPKGLRYYAKAHKHIEILRSAMNWMTVCSFRWRHVMKVKQYDKLMFANSETRNCLVGKNRNKSDFSIMTEIAIDSLPLQNVKQEEQNRQNIVFLAAGRMIYRKGFDFLLDVVERLPDNLNYECRIIGDGPELKKLRARAESSSVLKKHVIFTGAVPYELMKTEYTNADVFILPSIRETTGSVLLEAMSQGLPIITVKRFGGAELVDEETGWFFDGVDRETFIGSCCDAMMQCIMDRGEVLRRGMNAAVKVECFTWEKKNLYYQDVYREVIDLE